MTLSTVLSSKCEFSILVTINSADLPNLQSEDFPSRVLKDNCAKRARTKKRANKMTPRWPLTRPNLNS